VVVTDHVQSSKQFKGSVFIVYTIHNMVPLKCNVKFALTCGVASDEKIANKRGVAPILLTSFCKYVTCLLISYVRSYSTLGKVFQSAIIEGSSYVCNLAGGLYNDEYGDFVLSKVVSY